MWWKKKRWLFLIVVALIAIWVVIAQRPPHIEPGSYLIASIGGAYDAANQISLLK